MHQEPMDAVEVKNSPTDESPADTEGEAIQYPGPIRLFLIVTALLLGMFLVCYPRRFS